MTKDNHGREIRFRIRSGINEPSRIVSYHAALAFKETTPETLANLMSGAVVSYGLPNGDRIERYTEADAAHDNAEALIASLEELTTFIDSLEWGKPYKGRPHAIVDRARDVLRQVHFPALVKPVAGSTYNFHVEHHGERGAGIHPYSDTVFIEVESGEPGGSPGEFKSYMFDAIANWFDGALVEPLEDYRARVELEQAEEAKRRG